MTALVFNHDGYTVVTNSWSVSGRGKGVRICYVWGADRVSFFDSATGTAAVTIPGLTLEKLLDRLGGSGAGNLCDLRGYQ